MKIVILTSEFPPGPGGIADHAFNLAEQLVEKQCEVTVITEYRKEFEEQWKGFKTSAKVKYAQRGRYFGNVGFVFVFIHYFLITRKAIWIATGSKSLTLLGIAIYLSKRKSLAILHGHEMLESHGLKSRLNKMMLRYFTRVVAVSEFSKRNSLDFVDVDKVQVIPNGFNHLKYGAPNPSAAKYPVGLNLLTVGRVSKRKGQHNVINALPLILKKYPSVIYHIVGINDESDFINRLIDNNNLRNHIHIHGVLTDEQLASLFQKTDIFLMMSENREGGDVEGFGIAIIEANYFRIPAIGSLGCGIEQAIKDEFNGKLVPSNDTVSIAASIDEIMTNYKTYSENARTWSRDHYWTSVIHRYMSVLSSL